MTEDTIALRLDGYTDLPPGKIANIVTYFEMTEAPERPAADRPDGFVVRRLDHPTTQWYRDVIRLIGDRWLWVHIPLMPEEKLAALLGDPAVEIHVIERDGAIIGVAELDRHRPEDVEIVMFGMVPDAIGTGAAVHLMDGVLTALFDSGTRRVWLHTCTNDHPAAIGFYRRCGFTPYKFAIEVMDDPRLSGAYPDKAAPHIPLIRPKTPPT